MKKKTVEEYICPECGCTFIDPDEATAHEAMHSTLKSFKAHSELPFKNGDIVKTREDSKLHSDFGSCLFIVKWSEAVFDEDSTPCWLCHSISSQGSSCSFYASSLAKVFSAEDFNALYKKLLDEASAKLGVGSLGQVEKLYSTCLPANLVAEEFKEKK